MNTVDDQASFETMCSLFVPLFFSTSVKNVLSRLTLQQINNIT